jgi:hypothetical protein
MANNAYAAIRLTGGTAGCLDDLIHTNITDGDIAFVMDKSTDKAYILYWDSSSTASESTTTPTIVVNPDSAPSTGRWLSTSLQSELLTGTAATDTKLMYQLVEKLATTSTGVSVTGLVACTTMNVGSTIAITGVLDEDAMGSDSAVSLATQQSIKAYVDTQVATQLANIVEDTTPQLGGDLDVNGKDITSPDGTDLIDIVDGAIDIQTASTSRLDINDSGVRMGASGSRVTTILDEDAMGTDSDTALATQQSIKAYVDASSASGISNVVEDTTPQLGGDLDMNGKGIEMKITWHLIVPLNWLPSNLLKPMSMVLLEPQVILAWMLP